MNQESEVRADKVDKIVRESYDLGIMFLSMVGAKAQLMGLNDHEVSSLFGSTIATFLSRHIASYEEKDQEHIKKTLYANVDNRIENLNESFANSQKPVN